METIVPVVRCTPDPLYVRIDANRSAELISMSEDSIKVSGFRQDVLAKILSEAESINHRLVMIGRDWVLTRENPKFGDLAYTIKISPKGLKLRGITSLTLEDIAGIKPVDLDDSYYGESKRNQWIIGYVNSITTNNARVAFRLDDEFMKTVPSGAPKGDWKAVRTDKGYLLSHKAVTSASDILYHDDGTAEWMGKDKPHFLQIGQTQNSWWEFDSQCEGHEFRARLSLYHFDEDSHDAGERWQYALKDAASFDTPWRVLLCNNGAPSGANTAFLTNPEIRNIVLVAQVAQLRPFSMVRPEMLIRQIIQSPNVAALNSVDLLKVLHSKEMAKGTSELLSPTAFYDKVVDKPAPIELEIRTRSFCTGETTKVIAEVKYLDTTKHYRITGHRRTSDSDDDAAIRAELSGIRQILLERYGKGPMHLLGSEAVSVEVSKKAVRKVLQHVSDRGRRFSNEARYPSTRLYGSTISNSAETIKETEDFIDIQALPVRKSDELYKTNLGDLLITMHAVEKVRKLARPRNLTSSWQRLLELVKPAEWFARTDPMKRIKHQNDTYLANTGEWAFVVGFETDGEDEVRVLITTYNQYDEFKRHRVSESSRLAGNALPT